MATTYYGSDSASDISGGRQLLTSGMAPGTELIDGSAVPFYTEPNIPAQPLVGDFSATVEVVVSKSATFDVQVSRVNSSGVLQSGPVSSDGGAQSASTEGFKNFNISSPALGTWNTPGDRLLFEVVHVSGDTGARYQVSTSGVTVPDPLQVSPSGVASTATFGTAQIDQAVSPSGIASAAAFGTALVAPDQEVGPSGIASAGAFGALSVNPQIEPSGIASTAAFGTLSVNHQIDPSSITSTVTFGTPNVGAQTISPSGIASTSGVGSPQLARLAAMALLHSSLSTSHRCTMAEYKHLGYVNNGWDKLLRWDGKASSIETAGIEGPSTEIDSWTPSPTEAAGDGTPGLHLVRYRYLDSKTGYVSNPSEEREVSITSGNGKLTFTIGAAGSGAANIIRSSDAKVDRIVIEMSPVNDATFYTALEVENSASSAAVDISDPELEVSFLPYPDTGHDPPPVAKNVVSHRDRLWLFGQVIHSTGNANVTNGSVDVTAGSTDPDWRASALGDTVAGTDTKSVQWFFQRDGDSRAYEIDTYDAGNNKLILKDSAGYQGSTGSDVSYKVFSRANVIWVSEAGYPESFSPLKFLNGPNGERAGDITAGVGYFSSMLFFTESTMLKVAWDAGPLTDPQQFVISDKYGALSQRVVVEVDGIVYAMDRRGWTAWRGVFPELISRPIDALRASIDYDQADNFHACFFPELRAIRWFVSYAGETYPKHYVQFDIDTQTWSTGEYHQGIADSRLVPSDEGLRVLYGDDQGHVWLADRDTADGCDPDVSRLAADAGATTTVVPITGATLPIGGSGLQGCYLYHLTSGEARLVSSNTSSEITVATAFSSAPSDGDILWVGPIPSKLRTKAFRARNLGRKTQPRQCWVEFTPLSSTRYLQMRVYDDLSSTAKTWATGARNNPDGTVFPGANTQYPSSDWLIDLAEADGNVEVNIGSEFRRYFEIEFEINEPDAPLELVSLEILGTELEDEQ